MDIILLTEIMGFIGIIVSLISLQVKHPRIVLWLLCVPCAIWFVNFLLLGQIAGAVASFLCVVRNVCGAALPDHYMKLTTCICTALSIGLTLLVFKGWFDILPMLAAIGVLCAVMLRDQPFKFRLSIISADSSWAIYGGIIGSNALIVASLLNVSSAVISIIRHDVMSRGFAQKVLLKFSRAQSGSA